jgi:hypothetical protein
VCVAWQAMCPQALKMFLPSVLRAMSDRSWKIKSSATKLLSDLSKAAPAQVRLLSASHPALGVRNAAPMRTRLGIVAAAP